MGPSLLTPGPLEYVIGFNLVMGALSAVIERGAQRITIALTSPGGAPDQAFYAYEILRKLPAQLTTFALGPVQSAAVTIFMAGEHRYATPHANFLLHNTTHAPAAGSVYVHDQLTLSSSSIRADDARFIDIAAERTGRSTREVRKWMRGQKLRSAQWALEQGLVQNVRAFEMPKGAQFFQVTVS
jgi:ATP-dependent Clp protease protease subunit